MFFFFFFQAEDGIRDLYVTGVQTCALPIWLPVTGHPQTVVERDARRALAEPEPKRCAWPQVKPRSPALRTAPKASAHREGAIVPSPHRTLGNQAAVGEQRRVAPTDVTRLRIAAGGETPRDGRAIHSAAQEGGGAEMDLAPATRRAGLDMGDQRRGREQPRR